MLYYLIAVLHVLVCLILILVVLLQSGKGADLAGAFGGGATQTAFGSRGPASFLSKLTTISAVIFMITCLSLSVIGSKRASRSVLDTTTGTTVPASKAPAVEPPAKAPTREEIKKMQDEIEAKQKAQPPDASKSPAAAPAAAPKGEPPKAEQPPAPKKP
jgi:preprotein translocase subunit SecG